MRTIQSRLAKIAALLLIAALPSTALAIASKQVPIKGTAAGAVVAVQPGPAGVRLTIHSSGNATHLGHYTRVEELLLDPVTGTFTGTIVFVAANSDELWADVVGGFISPTTAVGQYAFVGGTGRFAAASGDATFQAESPDGIQLSVRFVGTLSSVGP
jgi:hypothetical protein